MDLPGGKRHLGEDSWGAAVRETSEEALIRLDGSGDGVGAGGGGRDGGGGEDDGDGGGGGAGVVLVPAPGARFIREWSFTRQGMEYFFVVAEGRSRVGTEADDEAAASLMAGLTISGT